MLRTTAQKLSELMGDFWNHPKTAEIHPAYIDDVETDVVYTVLFYDGKQVVRRQAFRDFRKAEDSVKIWIK